MNNFNKEDLIQKVKNKCYITDNSSLINNRIKEIVEDAIPRLKEICGIPLTEEFDFSESGVFCDLFKNYCFYKWYDKSPKEFEEAYISDIMKCRNKYMIENQEDDVNV